MFYKGDQLEQLLKCKRCKERYEKPKVISPCIQTICNNCVIELTDNDEFNCFFCNAKHKVPDGGFKSDLNIEMLLQLKAEYVIQTSHVKELRTKLNELGAIDEKMQFKMSNLEGELDEHCRLVRNQIDLVSEKKIEEINDMRVKCLKYVDSYKNDCISNINAKKSHLESDQNSCKKFMADLNDYLKEFQLDEQTVKRHIEETESKILQLKGVIENLESIKFNDKKLLFQANDEPINYLTLGNFNFQKIEQNTTELESQSRSNVNSSDSFADVKKRLFSQEALLKLVEQNPNNIYISIHENVYDVTKFLDEHPGGYEAIEELKIKPNQFKDATESFEDVGHSMDARDIMKKYQIGVLRLDNDAQSPFNFKIVSSFNDGKIELFNFNNNKREQTFDGHSRRTNYMDVIDKHTIVSCSDDNTIKVWNLVDGSCIKTLTGHTSEVHCVKTLNENTLVSCSKDKEIKVWSLENGQCLQTFTEHQDEIFCLCVINQHAFATSSADQSLKIWDIGKQECTRTIKLKSACGFCIIDNDKIATLQLDGTFELWNIETGICLQTFKTGYASFVYPFPFVLGDSNVGIFSFSFNNFQFQNPHLEASIKIINLNCGACVKNLVLNDFDLINADIKMFNSNMVVINRNTIAFGATKGEIKIWNLDDGTSKSVNLGHQKDVLSLKILQ